MKTIAFTAQAFGFGPVSKMLAVSELIFDVRKIFFGTGTAYDLAKIHTFDEVHKLENDDRDRIFEILQRSDVFVNVMDFSLSVLAKQAGCYQILIDSLFWFWEKIPAEISLVNQYLCQEFFGKTKKRLDTLHLHNAKVIGPIQNEVFPKYEKKDQVMINFGGMESHLLQVGKNTNYPFIILESLLPLLQNVFSLILVVGRERVMQMCKDKFSTSNTTFTQLSRTAMLEEIYQSQAFFTVPGIQSFYDGIDKVAIFMLPPQSSSNRRNLKILIENRVVSHYFQWEEMYNFDQKEVDEVTEISQVLDKMALFSADEHAQMYFQKKVSIFLESTLSLPRNGVLYDSGLPIIQRAIKDALTISKHCVSTA